MTAIIDTMRATCAECGHTATLAGLALHSCELVAQGGLCEDYPCCGHTDGDGCQTLPRHTSEFYRRNPAETHLGCDHNTGHCDYEDWEGWDDDGACPKCETRLDEWCDCCEVCLVCCPNETVALDEPDDPPRQRDLDWSDYERAGRNSR